MISTPDTKAAAVHLASLLALFFSSVASTAPRCVSSLCLQSTPAEGESNLSSLKGVDLRRTHLMPLGEDSVSLFIMITISSSSEYLNSIYR